MPGTPMNAKATCGGQREMQAATAKAASLPASDKRPVAAHKNMEQCMTSVGAKAKA